MQAATLQLTEYMCFAMKLELFPPLVLLVLHLGCSSCPTSLAHRSFLRSFASWLPIKH